MFSIVYTSHNVGREISLQKQALLVTAFVIHDIVRNVRSCYQLRCHLRKLIEYVLPQQLRYTCGLIYGIIVTS